jgi:acetolactate synthase I/II/III large subunit
MKTIASILVSHFKVWGVRHVFGIPGRPLAPLLMEIDKQGVNFILAKHESGGGYAAAGYALINKGLGIAIGTSGPGGTNLLTASGQAKAYHIPVLFITGQQPIRSAGKALGQDSTIFGTDLVKMFEPVTKFSARIERADHFQRYLHHALEKAHSGVKGPVHLSIPLDILEEEIEEFELGLPNGMTRLISSRLDEFTDKLDNAKRPVILSGKGVHSSLAYNEVKTLAELCNIPVATTPGGKGTFIENHPLSLGALGLGGTESASAYINQGIDLMIVIGSKLSDMSLVDISPNNHPKEVIHLDYDPTFIGKALPVPTLPIIGDIKANLQSIIDKVICKMKGEFNLSERLAERWNYGSGSLEEVAVSSNSSPLEEPETENSGNDSYISIAETMKILREEIPDDSIVFGDDGSHTFYAIKHFNIRKPGTFFFDDVFGAMGHAIGFSIGAQLANYDSRIFCLTGDGCAFMHGTEISTAANYNIPVTFIILNNKRLDMPYRGMQLLYGIDGGTTYNIPLNAKKLGESMSIKSFKCCNQFELRAALKVSNLHNEPILIEVMVDPYEVPPTMKRG